MIAHERPARLTVVPLKPTRLISAAAIAFGCYLVFLLLKILPFTSGTWLARVLADSQSINLGSYIAFAIAITILLDRSAVVTTQNAALDSDLLSDDDQLLILPQDALALRQRLRQLESAESRTIPIQLLDAGLQRARISWSAADVGEAIKTRAETIQGQIDSEYSLVRYLAWAIPSIGFIGTVFGLGSAIGAMRVVEGIEESSEQRMQLAIGYLFTAFDTTLVALILSIVVMFMFHRVQAREDSLLVTSLDWCMRRFVLHMHVPQEND